jgi:4-hydroxy-3-polyprenylbenzoate decarboxylase
MRLIVGISGASGVIYGIRLLEVLKAHAGVETHLVISNGGKLNISLETGFDLRQVEQLAAVVHSDQNLAASIASGSFHTDGMIVAPCSMKTLSGIVNSYADTLMVRAADVVLKERRRLVLVPREMPLHEGHCRLMYEAARMGAIMAPPMPAFYNEPQSVDDIVNHTVGRLLDLFGIDSGIVKRWQGAGQSTAGKGGSGRERS